MPEIKYAKIHFNENGTPVSEQFDDIYFSNQNGIAETEYVFLHHNKVIERVSQLTVNNIFTIAETGFGTGLNFLTTWHYLSRQFEKLSCPQIHFISFEKYPLTKSDLEVAFAGHSILKHYCEQLLAQYPAQIDSDMEFSFEKGKLKLTVLIGDVKTRIKDSAKIGNVDAWYLDGFAPRKNPDMWQQSLFEQIALLSAPGATLSTFTAAGFVRRGLISAGFTMFKAPGFANKREMLYGEYKLDNIS